MSFRRINPITVFQIPFYGSRFKVELKVKVNKIVKLVTYQAIWPAQAIWTGQATKPGHNICTNQAT